MRTNKLNRYTKYLMFILTLQVLLMFLNLAFALWGEYMHGYSSNIWAIIWNKGLIGLWTLLAGLVTVVSGITGIVIHKGNKIQCVLSVVTIASIIPGLICFIFAIGSKF